MTGIRASSLTRRIRLSPPRGMQRSIYSGIRSRQPHRGPIRCVDQLHGIGGQAGFGGRLGQDRRNGGIGVDGLFAAAEDHGVAGLHAKGRGVGGHIRPRFVDEEDHAQADADFLHFQARWVGWNWR